MTADDPNAAPAWVKALTLTVGGALIGVLIMLIQQRLFPGLAITLVMIVIGAILALPSVSSTRIGKLFIATTIARNVPGAGESAYDWVDETEPDVVADPMMARFGKWVCCPCSHPRHWVVVLGALAGATLCISLAVNDVFTVRAGQPSVVLQTQRVSDTLYWEAAAWIFGGIGWGAVLGGIVASSRYRRPLLVGIPVIAIISLPPFSAVATTGKSLSLLFGVWMVVATIPIGLLLLAVGGLHHAMAEAAPEKPKRLFEDRPR
ncbi:hypothetical protein [Blastopirellula retiformator]|uniref:Uncharacterized protein n=1 Tax=Blastopirellula retiformator TaxID=2527970 RepID=A0A5C5V3J6_9BACT|nr:hypothetical protein [Blastopirellula retiformator]TWT32951.1 hypothetical protein Enr8_27670 [Blastopirellula retiformator]